MEKTCKICNSELPISDFYPVRKVKNKIYYSSYCKTCQNKKSKQYRSDKKVKYMFAVKINAKPDSLLSFDHRECRKILEYLCYAEEYIGDALNKETTDIKDKIFGKFPHLKEFSIDNKTYEVLKETEAKTITGKDIVLKKGQILFHDEHKGGFNTFSLTKNYDTSDLIVIQNTKDIMFYGL